MQQIRSNLVLLGVLIISLSFVTIGVVRYNKAKNTIKEKSLQYATTQADKIVARVETALGAQMNTISSLSKDPSIRNTCIKINEQGERKEQELLNSLCNLLQSNLNNLGNDYHGIFLSDKSGVIYCGFLAEGIEYKGENISNKEFFIENKNSEKAAVGNTIRIEELDEPVYVVSAPMYSQNNDFIGVIGLLAKNELLTTIVSSYRAGQTGYAYMADSNGIIRAHPNKKFEMTLDLKTLDGLSSITEAIIGRKKITLNHEFKGVPKITSVVPVSFNGCSIAFTIDESELLHTIPKSMK